MAAHTSLHRTLLRTAALTAPVLALYGITPVFLLSVRTIPARLVFTATSFLCLMALALWLINIQLLYKRQHWPAFKRYGLSYAMALVLQVIPALLPMPRPALATKGEYVFLYPILFTLAMNTIIVALCESIIYSREKKTVERELQAQKLLNLEAQKQLLQQQLQPHFLFNTLSVLKSLIGQNAKAAEAYAVQLSAFLRYSIEGHNTALVTLDQECRFTQNYIALQQLRFAHSLQVDMEIPPEHLLLRLPAFGLQTLVENAIKHNGFTNRKPLHIRISTSASASITVWNNKQPPVPDPAGSTGMGLTNLKERYLLLAGAMPTIVDTEAYFEVTIPLLPV